MRYLKVFTTIIVLFIVLMFFSQNHDALMQDVVLKLDFFINPAWSSIPLPFYLMILVAFVLGSMFSLFILMWNRIRVAGNLRRANKRIRILEKEVNSLRTLPLKEEASAEVEEKTAE